LPSQANLKSVNLALNKRAQQSGGIGAGQASLAVDGNNDGNFVNGSVTHSSNDPNAWLDIDLGSSQDIDALRIWNRTDCCSYRLDNYFVFISDKPFLPSDNVSTLRARPGTWSQQGSQGNPKVTINTGRVQGRYVRLQFNNHPVQADNFLSVAEIEVLQYDAPIATAAASNVSFRSNFGSNTELRFESVGDTTLQYLYWPNPRLHFSVDGNPAEFIMRDGLYVIDLPQGNHVIKVSYKNWSLRLFIALMIIFALLYSMMLLPLKYREKFLFLMDRLSNNLRNKMHTLFKV